MVGVCEAAGIKVKYPVETTNKKKFDKRQKMRGTGELQIPYNKP